MISPVLAMVDTQKGTFEFAEINTPQLRADDLSATRGDGIFEAIWVRGEIIDGMEEHLERLVRSARAMGMPEPDLDLWRRVIHAVIAAHDKADELIVRLIISRGVDALGMQTAWCIVKPMPEFLITQRSTGIDTILLDRGYDTTLAARAPWLLIGAKTLSYAINMSAGRYAMAQGVDEAIFVSSDGYILEAPTASVVIAKGRRLITTDPTLGILHGTTQIQLFEKAARSGWETEYGKYTPEDLMAADGVWIVSSGRGLAPVKSIDGKAIDIDHAFNTQLNGILFDEAPQAEPAAVGK